MTFQVHHLAFWYIPYSPEPATCEGPREAPQTESASIVGRLSKWTQQCKGLSSASARAWKRLPSERPKTFFAPTIAGRAQRKEGLGGSFHTALPNQPKPKIQVQSNSYDISPSIISPISYISQEIETQVSRLEGFARHCGALGASLWDLFRYQMGPLVGTENSPSLHSDGARSSKWLGVERVGGCGPYEG